MIKQLKNDLNTGKWVHTSKTSYEYKFYNVVKSRQDWYDNLGMLSANQNDDNEESLKAAIGYFGKARVIYTTYLMRKSEPRKRWNAT